MQSEEGQELMYEWIEFGEALQKVIEPTPNGIHIHNDHMDEIEGHVDDIADEYRDLHHSKWRKKFEHAWGNALNNEEFGVVKEKLHKFHGSEERQLLEEEIKDVFEALDENVEVSDIPEHWKREIDHWEGELGELQDDMD